jgi:hypothetical protein
MRIYDVTHNGEDGLIRIRTNGSGRVLAAVTPDEARSLWINLGEELGLGTGSLKIRHVERAASLGDLSKRLKKTRPRTKK